MVSFEKVPFQPKGKADGGHGGYGGSILVSCSKGVSDLERISRMGTLKAEPGGRGGRDKKSGRSGSDALLEVPCGSLLKVFVEGTTDPQLHTLPECGEPLKLLPGGRGGRGNLAFISSTNQSPLLAEAGAAGRQARLELELIIPSDICVVGLSNSAKSSLLAAISNANPKVSERPFTTTSVVKAAVNTITRTTTVLEIPWTKGQEHLSHTRGAKLIAVTIDASLPNPLQQLEEVRRAIDSDKPLIVILTKTDLATEAALAAAASELERHAPVLRFTRHAAAPELEQLAARMVDAIPPTVTSAPAAPPAEEDDDDPVVLRPTPTGRASPIESEGKGIFRIVHPAAVRLAEGSNLTNYEALAQYRIKLKDFKVVSALEAAGAKSGDTVLVGPWDFLWG